MKVNNKQQNCFYSMFRSDMNVALFVIEISFLSEFRNVPHLILGMKKGSGRRNLYEICAANYWKPPVFECSKEEGPCHHRM